MCKLINHMIININHTTSNKFTAPYFERKYEKMIYGRVFLYYKTNKSLICTSSMGANSVLRCSNFCRSSFSCSIWCCSTFIVEKRWAIRFLALDSSWMSSLVGGSRNSMSLLSFNNQNNVGCPLQVLVQYRYYR